jgi:DNA-binding NarL/FixJ family response regulator
MGVGYDLNFTVPICDMTEWDAGLRALTAEFNRVRAQMERENQSAGNALYLEKLTPRQNEVLALLLTGKSNDEIAHALFISRFTVQTHVSHILAELGARGRTELISRYVGMR